MRMMPTQAPAASHSAENPAFEANSAPLMKVPDPIQVQIRVKTMTCHLRLRPATMNCSWLLIRLERTKFRTVSATRYARMMMRYVDMPPSFGRG